MSLIFSLLHCSYERAVSEVDRNLYSTKLGAFGVASCADLLPVCHMFLPHDEGKNDKALRMSAQESCVIKNKVQGLASYSFFGGLISVLYNCLKLVNTTCMHTTGDLSFFFPTFIDCILMLLWQIQ